jgi:hypothetical protein
MKTCAYCGRENDDNAVACNGCGTDEFKSEKGVQIIEEHKPLADQFRAESGTEFQIESKLRAIQLGRLILKLIAIWIIVHIAFSLFYGHPISHVRMSYIVAGFILTCIPCYGRTNWGRTIRFTESAIKFSRGQTELGKIPLTSVQTIKYKRETMTFKYQLNGRSKFKLIGHEGFSKTKWKELTDFVRTNIKPIETT